MTPEELAAAIAAGIAPLSTCVRQRNTHRAMFPEPSTSRSPTSVVARLNSRASAITRW